MWRFVAVVEMLQLREQMACQISFPHPVFYVRCSQMQHEKNASSRADEIGQPGSDFELVIMDLLRSRTFEQSMQVF